MTTNQTSDLWSFFRSGEHFYSVFVSYKLTLDKDIRYIY